jgi:choline dehydrogenase-like flavoprotein
MAYTRGSKEDFDRIAKVSGDQGWSWNSLLPYMKKVRVSNINLQSKYLIMIITIERALYHAFLHDHSPII